MKKFLPFLLVILSIYACKEKKKPVLEAEPVQTEITEPEVATPAQPVVEEVVKPTEEKEINKFFLIAGSFLDKEKAETFREQLSNKGFESEVLVRSWGPNQNYYRVSFQAFSEKKEALRALKENQASQTFEGVWVMIH